MVEETEVVVMVVVVVIVVKTIIDTVVRTERFEIRLKTWRVKRQVRED